VRGRAQFCNASINVAVIETIAAVPVENGKLTSSLNRGAKILS
jgi:hypothetical protein